MINRTNAIWTSGANRLLSMAAIACLLTCAASFAALRGHGGPVRALTLSADGKVAVTGSFDSSVIVWDLDNDVAMRVLRFHDGAVNATTMLSDGRIVTAGEDAKIAIWEPGAPAPSIVLEGHSAPIAAIAVAPDQNAIASASWDRSVRLWPLDGGAPKIFEGHADNVNGVAFSPDGATLISAGYDATLRLWPLDGAAPTVRTLPAPLNAVVVTRDGELIVAAADGHVRVLDARGEIRRDVEVAPAPVIALAVSPDGATIAAAGLRGAVALIDRKDASQKATLVGPALPVWALAFTLDGGTVLAAGSDRLVRRWDARTGEARDGVFTSGTDEILRASAGDPGAEVFRACVACHTLTPNDENRAGPTLHRLFGRKIASASGYRYSDALTRMDIVWTPETVSKLFEVGPNAYTPGTKMPEQTLSAPDRDALMTFLARAAQ